MASNILIDDYVLRRRTSILFNEAMLASVVDKWEVVDPMITMLNSIELFSNLRTWSQLEPLHWRLLICNTFNQRDKYVDPNKFNDAQEPIISTLYFLIMGLVHSLELRTTGTVDTLRVMRVSEIDVTFEFTITMIPEKRKHSTFGGLQIVVDNTVK